MIRYTLTRLALLLLGLLVASVLIFLTLRVLPGDIAQLIAGTPPRALVAKALANSGGIGSSKSRITCTTFFIAGFWARISNLSFTKRSITAAESCA